MTSIPASRSARAMIFAPRSCPSSPGLATTTRILRSAMTADSLGLLLDAELHAHVGRMDVADDRVLARLSQLPLEAALGLQGRLEAGGAALDDHVVLVVAPPVPLDGHALLDRHGRHAALADEEVVADLDVARPGGGWGHAHDEN